MLNAARDSGLKRNGNFVVVKHPLDDLDKLDKIGTHDAMLTETPDEIYDLISSNTSTVIIAGISHFEDEGIVDLVDSLVRSGRRVIATGLNLDSEGQPYGHMTKIAALADEVILAKAICNQQLCSNDRANRSVKIDGRFEPRCSHHYRFEDSPPISEGSGGSLNLVVGSMFASKSNTLAKQLKRYNIVGFECVVFKWSSDLRYGEDKKNLFELGKIKLHDGKEIEAVVVKDVDDMRNYLKEKPRVRIIMVDEAQFFPKFYDFANELILKGYKIFATGLVRGFKRVPFGDTSKLICLADNIDFRYGVCVVCGNPATENQRLKIVNDVKEPAHFNDPLLMVGGKEAYEARCIHDWKLLGEPQLRYNIPRFKG